MHAHHLLSPPESNHWPTLLSRVVLFGIGGLLTGICLYDLFLELGNPGYPFWVSLVESIPVTGLSAAILVIGVRVSANDLDRVYLTETAKGCLIGFAGALGVALALLLLRQVRGEGAPMVYLLTSAGTFAGTLVGYYRAQDKRVRRELRSITENVTEGLYRSTPEEGIIFANQAFAETFGFESTGALFEMDPGTLYANSESREHLREQARARGKFEDEEVRLKRKDGSTFTGCLSGTVERGEDGEVKYYDGVVVDVTERINREEALRAAKEKAEEANRMKSSFLANMSHEIRTPLTSIIGFAEAIGTEAKGLELPEGSPLPKYAGLIEQGGKRLLDTLEGVLNLSKLEAGQMELCSEPVDLATEVQRTAEELRREAREKKIDLRLQAEAVQAAADEGGVQIVLRNLLSNAIKYTEEGETVCVRTYREEGQATLEVEDSGIGMKPSVVEDLFEPFRQASEGFNREYEGTGVGLAVTKMAIEKMGGSIEVETEKGEGSRFIARLPEAEESASEGPDA